MQDENVTFHDLGKVSFELRSAVSEHPNSSVRHVFESHAPYWY